MCVIYNIKTRERLGNPQPVEMEDKIAVPGYVCRSIWDKWNLGDGPDQIRVDIYAEYKIALGTRKICEIVREYQRLDRDAHGKRQFRDGRLLNWPAVSLVRKAA